jgi:septin 7
MSSNGSTKSTAVSSIIKDNYLASANGSNNREQSADKSSLITSLNYNLSHLSNSNLNSSAASSNSGGGHLYQNVSNFKQIQNLIQQSSVGGGAGLKMNQPSGQVPPVPSTPVPTSAPQAPQTNGGPHHATEPAPANNTAPAANAVRPSSISKLKSLDGYVGFANLPNQVYRKAVKKGFEFNLIVIGESGLGKSTFINSLFLAELYNAQDYPGTFERKKKTTCVESTSVMLTEKNVNLKLTVVDTPGFGESINNTNCWQPLIDYIDNKYEDYLGAESKINRKLPINDQRIHCCLHFIAPGHT